MMMIRVVFLKTRLSTSVLLSHPSEHLARGPLHSVDDDDVVVVVDDDDVLVVGMDEEEKRDEMIHNNACC